ncbi:NRDE family protein [Robertkochia aurantiaca]|uniref:NRDE family protein n=1 Tax=Robertkochia aurantiaca TaxID=2873700 RepID=UPI001CCA17A3|nr:NRDE family protein [Robertkochia sp. 3YJGBD-33]
MCTVSYIPVGNGYIFTSNRDEAPGRKTLEPRYRKLDNGHSFYGPVDGEKMGSWIAKDDRGRLVCLLNGGFEFHKHDPPYRRSRGLILTDALSHEDFVSFIQEVELQGVEPFTLILLDELLQVLVWDGENRHHIFLDKNRPHLWSSATLYSSAEHQKKLSRFERFLESEDITAETVLDLHGLNQVNNFILDLGFVKTVSITQVIHDGRELSLHYYQNIPERMSL